MAGLALGGTCDPSTVAVDTTGWRQSVSAMWGSAPGQTFVAEDSVITAITVWRIPPQDTSLSDFKLWIVDIDSTGRPQNNRVVYDGPSLRGIIGDGMHPVEIRFDLDPPAILPRRGVFAFMVQNVCEWFFDLLVQEETYKDGKLWRSEIAHPEYGCTMWTIFDHWDEYDLCFKIEFCDATTPTRRSSWGRVKSIYR